MQNISRDVSACTVEVQKETIFIINVYNQPTTFMGFEAMETLLRNTPTSILLLPTILVTDSNLHSSQWNPTTYQVHDAAADRLVEVMLRWNFYLRSPKGVPTYEAKPGMASGVTIDLVWVNQQADDLLVACLVDSGDNLNHHLGHLALITVITVNRDERIGLEETRPRTKAWYKTDHTKFFRELKAHLLPISPPCSSVEVDFPDSHILDIITLSLNKSSPNKTTVHKHQAWWNPHTMGPLRRAADLARKRAKLLQTEEARATYRSARNLYLNFIEKEKVNSWRRYLSTLTVDTPFQAKKYASGPKTSSLIPTLISRDGTQCVSNNAKASALFNATCVATAECDTQDIPALPFPRSPHESATYFPYPSDFFSKIVIKEALNDAHPMKAPGPDGIQNWVWALSWDILSKHITMLFHAILQQGHIPSRWKISKTVMLAKPGKDDYTQPGSYRPIALLNTLAKLFEKALASYMSRIAEQHQVLHSGHYGARPNRSSQEALIHLVSWVKAQWRAGRVVGAIFADVKSAFPSVHHPRMLHTLETQGFPPELINIIHNFLTDRTTYLLFNGFESEQFTLSHGLPQGSPLSPLLYLLYNNSLLALTDNHPFSESLGFVDDVVLMTAATNQHEFTTKVQALASEQIIWVKQHGTIFDVQKSKWVIFTQSNLSPDLTIMFGDR